MRSKFKCGLRPLFLVPVAMALVACTGITDRSTPPHGSYKAEIRRTAMGVPHIKADDWAGAGYGYGYAQAQDDLCTMADSFLTYRGERSQFFGSEALLLAKSTIGQPRNIDSDFFHKHVVTADVVGAMARAQPASIRGMVEGFAAGYNRYVRELKAGAGAGNAHAACRNEAWVRPVSADDIYRRMYATNLAAGYSNFLSNIANAAPPAAKVSSREEHGAQPLALQVGGEAGVGSNMIGFGTASTGDASPLLFGNPHWYWRGPDRFYQAQLTIPGQLDVSGTSFLGVPVILIGFNDNIAWSHTVSAARRFGLFQLQLAPGDATSYLRDGRVVKMQARTVTVNVKQASGKVEPVTRTLYTSEYGPLVNLGAINPALAWSQSMAFAIRDINADNYRTFRTWLRWGQAKSLDELIAIQREEAAIPWVNTVAVGRGSAKAWYADIGAVPNVSPEQMAGCTTPAGKAMAAALPRVPVFDGSRSACDWQSDADSVQKGAVGPSRMPSLLRDDYVANMNDSYWLANPKAPLTGYPAIFGPTGSNAQTFRTRLGHLIAQDTSKGATVDAVERATLGSRAYTAELFKARALELVCGVPRIAVTGDAQTGEVFSPPRSVDTGPACAVLKAWNNTGLASARGAHVWDEFWARASRLPAERLYEVPFSASDPINTPSGLKASAAEDLRQAFGAAVLRVQASGYALDAPRGDTLFVTRNGQKIPLSGGCDGQGYFTILCSENRLDKGGYTMDANPNGNSYMQIVRFPAGGVEAHTFLTFSLSDDPASPHNADYTRAYSAGQWLRLPFSESEIKADAAYSSVTISE
ncbi:acyl-homoserine-lactone acylase [Variovorax sp. YR752]|uniref:penicillin acylase family protein n=1 Tax=Variovorax sp. YR752 TaxID=1884383 RepID=UPI000BD7E103|nr:penicillin acylase family protein [Variovorax sp. YR752]SOD26062.1 acyl-homoserine-lactone acylase [Variovorax sp. YR752]